MRVSGLRVFFRVLEPQVRERRGAAENFPPHAATFGGCPMKGQCAASPRVVGGMVVVRGGEDW